MGNISWSIMVVRLDYRQVWRRECGCIWALQHHYKQDFVLVAGCPWHPSSRRATPSIQYGPIKWFIFYQIVFEDHRKENISWSKLTPITSSRWVGALKNLKVRGLAVVKAVLFLVGGTSDLFGTPKNNSSRCPHFQSNEIRTHLSRKSNKIYYYFYIPVKF